MSGLPKGWTSTTIGKITLPIETTLPSNSPETEFQYLDISAIDNANARITAPKTYLGKDAPSRARQVVAENDTLFSTVRTYLKNIALVPKHLDGEVASTGFAVLRPDKMVEPKFLFHFTITSGFLNPLAELQRGTSYPAVRENDVRSQAFPLPPLAEQRRIVAKVEALFSELEAGVAALKQARAQLAVYRQALLRDAFEGRLTADWRSKHAPTLETGEQLLARIWREREERYQSDLRTWNGRKGNGALIINGELMTKPRKPNPPLRLDDDVFESLPALPDSWRWMTLESLASPAQRSIQSGPFGSSLKHDEFSESGMLVIGIDNVQKGYFSKGSENRIPPKTFERLRKYSARPHDVLMTVMATVGRCCAVPADIEKSIITKHVYRTSPNLSLVDPSFIVHALLGSPATVKAIEKDKIGQTRPGINGDILKRLPIPLPPLEEQREVMRVIAAQLEHVTALETDIDVNLGKAEALRQAILKKAFAGELVPQDPADEPAAALLARIAAEREAASSLPRAKTKMTRRKTKA